VATVREELARTVRVLGGAGGLTLLILIALVIRLHRNIVRPLRAMEGTMAGIAQSLDFTRRVPVARNDEIGQSVRAFNALLDTLQRSLGAMVGIIRSNEHATAEMHQSALVVAHIASEGSDSSKRIQQAVQSIQAHILEIDRESRQAGRISEESSATATSRSAVIRETANRIDALAAHIDGTSAQVFALAGEVGEIESVVSEIRQIADQTNLLALNAAIEGRAGRGHRTRLCGGCRRGAQARRTLGRGDRADQPAHRRHPPRLARMHRPNAAGRCRDGTEHDPGPLGR